MTDFRLFDPDVLPVYESPDTLFTYFVSSVRQYGNNIAYIYTAAGKEHRVTYIKLFEDVLLLARSFQRRGMSRGDKVMLLSDNRYAWMVTDLAMISIGAVNVPRGSDTPTQELEFIIKNAECTFLIVETDGLLESHKSFLRSCKQLKTVFAMTGQGLRTLFGNLYAYNDLLRDRRYSRKDMETFFERGEQLLASDLLTIIYTSGTTGLPKGVMLTHSNIMHNVHVVPEIIQLTEEDHWLSILPSWHIFERTAEYVAFARGTTLVYSSVKRFAQDLEKYRPTLVATVPRVWESLYSKVQATVRKKGNTAQKIFKAMLWGSAAYRRNRRKFFDRMPVFRDQGAVSSAIEKTGALCKMLLLYPFYRFADKKLAMVRQRFGGQLRLAISGGGTLAPYLEEWIDAVGIRIVNAYGMTECSPAIAGRGLTCRTWGTLGPPVAKTSLRIVSEEGEILPAGEEGSIEVSGAQVTPGYYNNEEENRKSFTEDGFFKTGDLGRMTLNGELVITGRAKEIIVLSSGENIDPTRIENALSMFPFIQDALLVGQDKRGLGALLVPNIEELREYVSKKVTGLKKGRDDFWNDGKVLEQVRRDLNKILLPKQGFKPYEKLQRITFLDKEFKFGEELTNTMKKKRHVIEKKYKVLINNLLR